MEAKVKAKRIGGSIGLILPREVVARERIKEEDILKVKVKKSNDLDFLWGKGKDVKKSGDQIMKEIDEGEDE